MHITQFKKEEKEITGPETKKGELQSHLKTFHEQKWIFSLSIPLFFSYIQVDFLYAYTRVDKITSVIFL